MKKLSGLLAVSLVAVMMAPAARADIASTGYVNKNMEAKANKKIASAQLDSNDDTGYPTVAAAFSIANIALGDQAVIKQQGTTSANKALITNAKGTVETGLITKDMIADKAVTTGKIADANVTSAKIATGAVTADKLGANAVITAKIADANVTTAKIADANVTEGKLAKDSVTPLKVKDGLIKSGTNVTVSRDATTGVVTISSADTKYTLPTATDTVLGGVKVDTAMSDTSTNPVQNKVANAAIADAKKAGTDAATAAANAKSAADAAQATANKAVVANTAITGGTKTKITYDAKGLVTGGSDLNADDIPALATGKITGLDEALAAKFVAPGTSVTSKDGTYTLTMKVVNNQPTYAWEEIGR